MLFRVGHQGGICILVDVHRIRVDPSPKSKNLESALLRDLGLNRHWLIGEAERSNFIAGHQNLCERVPSGPEVGFCDGQHYRRGELIR